jgi:hypothetical protein
MDDLQSIPIVEGVREPIYVPDPTVTARSALTAFRRSAKSGRVFASMTRRASIVSRSRTTGPSGAFSLIGPC